MTAEEVAVKIAEVEQRAKSNTRRVEKLELQTDAIQSLATSVEVLVKEQSHQTESMGRIEKTVEKLDSKVEALENKPAKKWESAVEKVVMTLIAAIIGFILAQIGLA